MVNDDEVNVVAASYLSQCFDCQQLFTGDELFCTPANRATGPYLCEACFNDAQNADKEDVD